MPIETADLERRVLAHERILQALIAHIDETEPKFMDRLKATVASGHVPGGNEQDATTTDQHAGWFIRQVAALGEYRLGRADPDAKVVGQNDDGTTMPASSRALSPID
ncbi:MAG: hypothetical protein P4L82_15060 [Ancalomicrobiaceae bacterium]|nr:hypothetical protein [Ancalomicrobiaceae bacterium]